MHFYDAIKLRFLNPSELWAVWTFLDYLILTMSTCCSKSSEVSAICRLTDWKQVVASFFFVTCNRHPTHQHVWDVWSPDAGSGFFHFLNHPLFIHLSLTRFSLWILLVHLPSAHSLFLLQVKQHIDSCWVKVYNVLAVSLQPLGKHVNKQS